MTEREGSLATIHAAPYRDRVVHYALCNVLEPVFERSFSPERYARCTNKGDVRRGAAGR